MSGCDTDTVTRNGQVRGICRSCQVSGSFGTQAQADAWVTNHKPNAQQ